MSKVNLYNIQRAKKFHLAKNYYRKNKIPFAREKGWYVIYDFRLVDQLHYDNKIDLIILHLWESYKDIDKVLALMDMGLKDPLLHRCFKYSGFYEDEYAKSIIIENWEYIILNSIVRYFKKDGANYKRVPHVKFGTYMNATFEKSFLYYFKDKLRKSDIEREERWLNFHEPIELFEDEDFIDKSDISINNIESIEFLHMLNRV